MTAVRAATARVAVRPLYDRTSLSRWYRVLQVIVCLPVLLALVRYVHAGFYPINDDAYTAMSSWDLFTGHWPTQGAHSTSVTNSGVEVHHPGPLYYYLLAPFLLLGSSGTPLVIGQATLAVGCGLGELAVARRLGGTRLATAVAVAWVATGLQLGDQIYARPFNPYPSVLVLPLLLLTTWGVLRERLELLPVWAFALALSVQPHLGNVPLALILVGTVCVVSLARWRRRRGVFWPLRGWRRSTRPRDRRPFWWALLVSVVVWLPVVVELFTRRPNNAQQFLKYLRAEQTRAGVGLGDAIPVALNMSTGWSSGNGRGLDILYGHALRPLTVPVFVGAAVMVAVLAVPLSARASDPRRAGRLLCWAALLDLTVAVYAIGLARLDPRGFISWEYVQLPVVWSLLWTTLAVEVWWVVRLAHAAGRFEVPRRLTAHARPRAVLVVVGAVLAAATWFTPQDANGATVLVGRNAHAALPSFEDAVRGAGGAGAAVEFAGDSIGASYDIGWALGYGLLRDGFRPHIATFGSLHEYWDYRKYTTAPRDAVRVYITDSQRFPTGFVPAGTKVSLTIRGAGASVYRVYVTGRP